MVANGYNIVEVVNIYSPQKGEKSGDLDWFPEPESSVLFIIGIMTKAPCSLRGNAGKDGVHEIE